MKTSFLTAPLPSLLTLSHHEMMNDDYEHSIYFRTVSSQLPLYIGTFLAGLGQKSSVLCMLFCPNGQ